MYSKLAFRNVMRSAKDYLVYMFTMAVVTALMYAFSSLFFDKEFTGLFEIAQMMQMMTGMATFFIVLIVAWLINYMVRFMLEKRSSEFGIYMLLGMKKKAIARLYMRENVLLGIFAFLAGVPAGILLQQALMAVLGNMVHVEYRFHPTLNKYTFLVTLLFYAGCYLLALFRCKRKFKKMNIHDLMDAKRQNEEIKESNEGIKRLLFPVSIAVIVAIWTVFPGLSSVGAACIFLIALVLVIYLFYIGLSAWVMCYIRKKKKGIYRGQNLFLLRQFSSKVRTMQFTMGTLTALFTIALMGSSVAMMFSDYENKVLDTKWPFDVLIYSSDAEDEFQDDLEILNKDVEIADSYIYRIYTNQTNQANVWMYTHLQAFGNMYLDSDGRPNMKKIEKALKTDGTYCTYDTYMGLSDYNYLRKMLGYKEITLTDRQYAIQIKARLSSETDEMPEGLEVTDAGGNEELTCAGIYTEPFSQDGHNGGDYILIVPDSVIQTMKPYYSEMAVDLKGKAPAGLMKKLDDLVPEEEQDFAGHADLSLEGNSCSGSDNMVSYNATNLVRDNVIPEVKYMLASLIVPAFYMGLVFLCAALTVLSVQQLSDSAKYKFRYDVLAKIGLERSEINYLIARQLTAYYLCPALFAMIISGSVMIRVSRIFIMATGVHTSVLQYFGISVLLFFGIYMIYFMATYVGFKRNIEGKK
ncbi:ABC transporter permease [Muricomes intestini]|uniref:ABC transporter permease n=2 Tax=Muricomes intestini TaxID=1796634 RepID=UPI002FE03F1F